jgi:hypothetical protein
MSGRWEGGAKAMPWLSFGCRSGCRLVAIQGNTHGDWGTTFPLKKKTQGELVGAFDHDLATGFSNDVANEQEFQHAGQHS